MILCFNNDPSLVTYRVKSWDPSDLKSKEISLHENIKYLDYPRLTASIADNVSNIRALGC